MNDQTKYQKREICLLDIPSQVQKKDIDLALKSQNFQLTKSRIEKKINVEFKSAHVAWQVRKFLLTKELTYQGKPFRFIVRGNRILIHKGFEDASFDELRAFFNNYGEVNNIYLTKQYFAVLSTITDAIKLVETIGSMTFDGHAVQFKYAFDNNIGKATNPITNFEIKNKGNKDMNSDMQEVTIGTRMINIQMGNQSLGNRAGSQASFVSLGANGLSGSKISLNSGNSANSLSNSVNGGPQPGQKKKKKQNAQSGQQANHNPNHHPNQPKVAAAAAAAAKLTDDNVKLNVLDINKDPPLFSRGPEVKLGAFNSLNNLNYNGPGFKPIDYLENKAKQQQQSHPPLIVNTKANKPNPATVLLPNPPNHNNYSTNQPINRATPNHQPNRMANPSSDRYHYVATHATQVTHNHQVNRNPPTGSLPPFASPPSAQRPSPATKTAVPVGPPAYNAQKAPSTMPKPSLKPSATPNSATSVKVNHFAASPSASKPKKEDGCVMM